MTDGRLVSRLLGLVVPPRALHVMLADLEEEYACYIRPTRSTTTARMWYLREALSIFHHYSRVGLQRRLLGVASTVRTRFGSGRPNGPRRERSPIVDSTLVDLRFALRSLSKRPGFVLVVVLTLALGVGGNAAIFSVLDGVLFRPLPYRAPDQLALVWGRMSTTSVQRTVWSPPDVLDMQQQSELFEGVAAAFARTVAITGDFEPEQARVGIVTANLFEVLGVDAGLGRFLVAADGETAAGGEQGEEQPSMPIVLSFGLWQQRFGSDPFILGKTVTVGGRPMTVIGVAPRNFELLLPVGAELAGAIDLWSPIQFDMSLGSRDNQFLTVIARRKADATWEQAQTDMNGVAAQLQENHDFHRAVATEIDVIPMHRDVVGHARPVLLSLAAIVGFVLLIACANVANLLLVNGQVREREIAIRTALGGGRSRIIRQLLTECMVLAVGGGVAGVLLARLAIDLLLALSPANLPRIDEIGIDGRVLGFAAGVSLAALALFGVLPSLVASRTKLTRALKEGRGLGGPGRSRTQNVLVIAEVAVSLVLLVGTGLMIRSFAALQGVSPGFVPDRVLTTEVTLPPQNYRGSVARAEGYAQLAERLEALPGVEVVGGVIPAPLSGRVQSWYGPWAVEEVSDDELNRNEVDYRAALPSFFRSMGTRVLAGRTFTETDSHPDAPPVVVVDEKMARLGWPGENAIGKRMLLLRPGQNGFDRYWAEVVGVVEHMRYHDLRVDSRETIYFPWRDWGFQATLTIRTSTDPTGVATAVRDEIRAFDPSIPGITIRPMLDYVTEAMAPTRFAMIMIGAFGGVALVLASVGLYGVISYSVRRRVWEFGLRMAFGAHRGQILRSVLRQGLGLTVTGIVVGLAGSFLLTRTISGLLFGVAPIDPATFVAVPLLLAAITLVATAVPAYRATTADPTTTLRTE